MAAKEISVKKYVVRLSGEERERLEMLIRKGKSPARRVLKARIVLKADVSEAGKGWSDNRIIEALETSPSMVYRVVSDSRSASPVQSTSHISPWIAAFSKNVDNPGTASEPKRSFGGEHPRPVRRGPPIPCRRTIIRLACRPLVAGRAMES